MPGPHSSRSARPPHPSFRRSRPKKVVPVKRTIFTRSVERLDRERLPRPQCGADLSVDRHQNLLGRILRLHGDLRVGRQEDRAHGERVRRDRRDEDRVDRRARRSVRPPRASTRSSRSAWRSRGRPPRASPISSRFTATRSRSTRANPPLCSTTSLSARMRAAGLAVPIGRRLERHARIGQVLPLRQARQHPGEILAAAAREEPELAEVDAQDRARLRRRESGRRAAACRRRRGRAARRARRRRRAARRRAHPAGAPARTSSSRPRRGASLASSARISGSPSYPRCPMTPMRITPRPPPISCSARTRSAIPAASRPQSASCRARGAA